MKDEAKTEKLQETVRKRLGLIGPLIPCDPKLPGGGDRKLFNRLLKSISAQKGISTRQLRRLVDANREDPVAGLKLKYKGNQKFKQERYNDIFSWLDRAVELRRANTSMTVAEIIRKINQEYPASRGILTRSTVQRKLQKEGCGKREINMDPFLQVDDFLSRFEMSEIMKLLQGDLKYLPKCLVNGRLAKAYFVAWIDDKSRYVAAAGVFTSQEQYVVSETLRSVLQRYGLAAALYCDNGSIYNSRAISFACETLGIKLIHAAVRHSWAKGKVEALNRSISQLCHDIEDLGKPITIEALTKMAEHWVDEYNNTVHSALNGRTPKEVFFSEWNKDTARFYPQPVIEAAFLDTVKRRVNKDGTVKYMNVSYVIPFGMAKAGTSVELAVSRNGRAITVSLINEDLSLEPLEVMVPREYPNRKVEKLKARLKNKPAEPPREEDRGAAFKLMVMDMLEKAGCRVDFGGRNDLLDAAAEHYTAAGDIDAARKYVEDLARGGQPEAVTIARQINQSQAGYSCLLKAEKNAEGE